MPLLASVVPVLGAIGLWVVTGSVLSLWLAALGPLIAGATVLDAARTSRRDRRRAQASARIARGRISREIDERHAQERARRWARHPDVAAFLGRDGEIWRPVPGREAGLVLGSGVDASELRVTGGGDDTESLQLRSRAGRLEDAPIVAAPATGVAVVGTPVLAAAVVRALAMQLAMTLPPGELRLVGALRGENAWAESLPHRRATTGKTMMLGAPEDPVALDADVCIVRADPDGPRPPGCGIVLTVSSPGRVVADVAGETRDIAVEALGLVQAAALAEELAARAERLLGVQDSSTPIALATLLADAPAASPGRLAAVIGRESGEPFVLDLVADGPHAVVAGVTGSGKSELLVTWVLALCAAHSTRQVSFLLADFKGGTAFDALAGVPHVTGVLTDLEGNGARRAIESLRAEVRWRESELARVGARDVLDARVDLPRLVIVVDEFAALLAEHPELHAVFTDVAARGRALGMHLILGTQRPSGVVRESLLANCPLRISLRVTDPADSRALIGTSDAAALPGGPEARGLALVRSGSGSSLRRVRVALSSSEDREMIAGGDHGMRPRRPWLPELPNRIDLEDLVNLSPGIGGTFLIGLLDEPERQRQHPVGIRVQERGLLVVGSAGSGKSTALRTIAAQAGSVVVRLPAGAEDSWDAVAELCAEAPPPGSVVLLDDLDRAGAGLAQDYARELVDRLERVVRGAGEGGFLVLASAQRLNGGGARIADLLPRRLVLAAASRAEHVAAGGDPVHYAPASPPGRGRLDGRSVQVAMSPAHEPLSQEPPAPWHPTGPMTGFVLRRSPAARGAMAEWERMGARILSLDDYAGGADRAAGTPTVVAGDVEEWQRHWRVLTALRSDHDLVVDAACGPEFRLVTGERELPPYCEPGRRRAWLLSAGGQPSRITLPSAVPPGR